MRIIVYHIHEGIIHCHRREWIQPTMGVWVHGGQRRQRGRFSSLARRVWMMMDGASPCLHDLDALAVARCALYHVLFSHPRRADSYEMCRRRTSHKQMRISLC